MSDLEVPLIQGNSDYQLTSGELNTMFVPDNIKDGISILRLVKCGKIEGLFSKLQTNPLSGIDGRNGDDLTRRVMKYKCLIQYDYCFGSNKPFIKDVKTLWEYIIENFEDEMLKILCLAAAVALVVGVINEGWKEGWLDGLAIFIAVILIVSVTAGNNYVKDQQFRKLNAISENRCITTLRSGAIIQLNIYELLVGDVVHIETGEILPVDGLLFKSNNVTADESSITGETQLVRKGVPTTYESGERKSPFLISGSKVMEGTGEMLVLAVGDQSQWGQAKKLMESSGKQEKTPLQEKLQDLADDIGSLGFKVVVNVTSYNQMACLTFLSMTVHLVVERVYLGESLLQFDMVQQILNYFIVAVTIIVVAVPEGLPLAVTIALAYSVGKMRLENNLVRYLQACETMGGANNICSDKTGTLTKNLMSVTQLFVQEQDFQKVDARQLSQLTTDLLCEGLCLNSNAHPQIDVNGNFEQIGNKTECALLEVAYLLGQDFRQVREKNQSKVKKTIPFSSERKRMTTIYDYRSDRTSFRIYCKGAPDILLEKCTHFINKNDYRTKLNEVLKQYADGCLRTLLLTYRETMFPGKPERPEQFPADHEIENRLTVIALAGIKDPLKDGIHEAVMKCHNAGITVRMVTGDNLDTAVAISKEAGILPHTYTHNPDSFAVLEGKTFRQLVKGLVTSEDGVVGVGDLDNFRDITRELRVLARSSPEDKFILVTGLKQLDNVVAVTGDGTNDAPALKKADVGFAMGISGTEVAKDASGIILLDDNFSSIVTAIKWGRNIFECIRKFLQFQITVNIVAVFMAFMGGVILKESPLSSIQLLWVNLIMDTLASLALATEPRIFLMSYGNIIASEELLQRKPYGRKEYMITPGMWRNIICQAVWQIVILSILLFYGDVLFDIPSSRGTRGSHSAIIEEADLVHYTIFFNVFVFLQVFNEINCRKLKKTEVNVFEGFLQNPYFVTVIVGTTIFQVLLVQLGGKAVKVAPLSMQEHIACISIGMTSLAVGFIIKQIPDQLFESVKLFSEQRTDAIVDPNTIEGKFKRPSTILRKKKNLEDYKKVVEKATHPQEFELKTTGSQLR